jgi:DNA-binding transcriptional ArsR family regulator
MGTKSAPGRHPTAAQRTARPRALLGTADAVVALGALAQETRLAIYRLLVRYAPEGRTPGAIAESLDLAPATLSFHLKELTNAGLVTQHRDGRHLWYRADIGAMNALLGYLTEHCCRGEGLRVAAAVCATECVTAACAPKSARSR